MKIKLDKDLLKKVIEHFGEKNQVLKTIEGLSEFMRAVTRIATDKGVDLDNLSEEIADMFIMASQLIIMYDLEESIEKQIETKQGYVSRIVEANKGDLCVDCGALLTEHEKYYYIARCNNCEGGLYE